VRAGPGGAAGPDNSSNRRPAPAGSSRAGRARNSRGAGAAVGADSTGIGGARRTGPRRARRRPGGVAVRREAALELEVPHRLPGLGAELAVRIALVEAQAARRCCTSWRWSLSSMRLVLGPGALDRRAAQDPVAEMGDAHGVGVRRVVGLDHVVVLGDQEGRPVRPAGQEQGGLARARQALPSTRRRPEACQRRSPAQVAEVEAVGSCTSKPQGRPGCQPCCAGNWPWRRWRPAPRSRCPACRPGCRPRRIS
jgi:hypothetical protein